MRSLRVEEIAIAAPRNRASGGGAMRLGRSGPID
jgi:hypothetical protein